MIARGNRHAVADALRDRIVTGLHVGRLKEGARLPTVRELAAEFDVNERVVLAALRALADDGFIDLRPRSGAYVAATHPASDDGLPHMSEWLIGILVQARARGLGPRHLAEFVRRNLESTRARAACIECNTDQLHLLCTELHEDHGFDTESTPLDTLSADAPSAAVRRADVLVTTPFHADQVSRIAKALRKPWIAVTLRPEIMRDVARRLRRSPVYYVATDPRFERKLRRMLAQLGPTTNLHVLIVPRDDLATIPPNAPTFVMTSARDHVKRFSARARPRWLPIQPPRHFSDDAARELLRFLVRANTDALMAQPRARLAMLPRDG